MTGPRDETRVHGSRVSRMCERAEKRSRERRTHTYARTHVRRLRPGARVARSGSRLTPSRAAAPALGGVRTDAASARDPCTRGRTHSHLMRNNDRARIALARQTFF